MKPLALRLQAFGSYGGEFAVDFARLGRHGVFSITGPTGAGKSTIFDAIVYALYDDLPGFRVNSHIRSQYAGLDTRTEVTLEFEAEGRHWVLTRTPAQARPSGRAPSGLVEDASKVVLAEAGVEGSAVTRKREVNERIAELVGLDKAQFEQVVLIPQGRFEDVLKAKTQDRADLLAKLFPVDIFIRTTDVLRESAAERRQAYEELTQGRHALEDRIRVDVAAFRADAHPVAAGSATDPGGPGDDGPTDGDPPADDLDLTRLPGVRAELAADLTVVERARAAAAVDLEVARARRTDVEAAVVRWTQWRADLLEARDHPDQETADAALGVELARAMKVAALGGALDAWRQATDRLAALRAERLRLAAAVADAWIDSYDRNALDGATTCHVLASTVTARVRELEGAALEFTALQRGGEELDLAEHALAEQRAVLAAADADLEQTVARVTEAEAALRATAETAATRPVAVARVERLERDAAAVRLRMAARRRLADLTSQLQAQEPGLAEAVGRATALRTAWRSSLAGRLAAHLEDGAPCPTCGATEHPDPATSSTDAPTDDELDAAELEGQTLAEQHQQCALRVAEARATLDALPELPVAADTEELLAAARADLDAIDASAHERERRGTELDQLCHQVTAQGATVEGLRSGIDGSTGALAERRARWERDRDAFTSTHGAFASTAEAASTHRRLAAAVTMLAGTVDDIGAVTAAQAQQVAALAATMSEFGVDDPTGLEHWTMAPAEREAAQTGLDARAEHRRDVGLRISAYRDDGGPTDEPDLAPVEAVERAAVDAHDVLVGRVASMTGRLAAFDESAAALRDGDGAISRARLAKEEADTLAGLCAGSGSGPDANRLSLKNWVLAHYLRQVLAHANVRLHTMTNGRYALDLSGDHADGRRPWGLDISARDAETGQTRPATTLSGGETFMAALSLALGLADVVAAGSNYSIGALFIDEGFGSLDGDSLDTVIDVLRSLQDGGRMVGVISHVQELKDALPNGIAVAPTNRGSVATLLYPDG